ncbi:MAG TPA: NUDIX domain-containing protein [Candidatus Sulfotelmatobacter sp.]|nr:NUDIX domain-containing protein [Candidatus Sulfotelmatobacter sp.]
MTNSRNPANLPVMVREISAGGVVIRIRDGVWWLAAIEPAGDSGRAAAGRSEQAAKRPGTVPAKNVLALPKGLVDPGEKPLETALREVYEETGVRADLITKLGDIKYVYTRSWGDGARVFKIVSFYLMRYRSGRINNIASEMRIEVARARWVRLEDAATLLAYKGEKQIARRALEYVEAHAEV